ncbi:hypothetical protein [Fulvitalea axinellae]
MEKDSEISESKGLFKIRSRYPLLNRMVAFGLISFAGLIVFALSGYVESTNMAKGLLASEGIELFFNLMFLTFASAMGTSFLILSNIKDKFKDGTYHPDEDGVYWITIVLGITGGIIMSQMVPLYSDTSDGHIAVGQRVILALVGGFSSKLVYNIINKIIIAIETLVNGSEKENQESRLSQEKTESAHNLTRVQLEYINHLQELYNTINQTEAKEDIMVIMKRSINELSLNAGLESYNVTTSEQKEEVFS